MFIVRVMILLVCKVFSVLIWFVIVFCIIGVVIMLIGLVGIVVCMLIVFREVRIKRYKLVNGCFRFGIGFCFFVRFFWD